MKISSIETPTVRLLCAFMKITIRDIRRKIPTACPKNEREEAKYTAEKFLDTQLYRNLCDVLDLPAERVKNTVLAQKNSDIDDEEEE